jgi:hypothetical protein
MRHFVGLFGLVCSAIIIAVASRYGVKTSDSDFDGYIWAFIYGAITFAGLFGHMVAVRLWWRYRMRWLSGAVFIVCFLTLIISLSNSIGAMAGRMNTTQASRVQTAETVRAARRDLERAQGERERLKFEPTDWSAVEAARKKAETAKAAREAECNIRGQRCRDREEAEAKALAESESASKSKAATDHARELDAQIEKLTAKIAEKPVLEANSQGSALARLFGLGDDKADRVSTFQNLGMGIVLELLVALSLIIYELMTEGESLPKPARAFAPVASALPIEIEPDEAIAIAPPVIAPAIEEREEPQEEPEAPTATIEPEPEETTPRTFPPRRPRLIASEAAPFGNVAEILGEALETSARGKLELAPVFRAYSDACRTQGKRSVSQDRFVDDLTAFCRDNGIAMTGDDTGIYLRKVRLKASAKEAKR